MRVSRFAPLALLAPLALSPARPLAQRVDTVVRMAGAPKYAGVSTLVEEISIGVADGAEEYMFGDVGDIAVAKDGSIYVLDRQIPTIRMYDANGKYVRTIGRRGQGPGEIASPSGIGVLPDGRLLLWDTANWRVNVYSATGASLTHWSLPAAANSTAQMWRALIVDTAGAVYVMKSTFVRPTDGTRPRVDYVWLKLRGDGSIVDTVREPRWPRALPLLTATNGGSTKSIAVPFEPVPTWRISPLGYIVSGVPGRYAFELHTGARSVTSVRRDVQPVRVTAAERDSARKYVETSLRETDPGWGWGGVDVPRMKPAYETFALGLDGRIWITRISEVSPRVGSINSSGGAGRGAPPRPAPAVEAAHVQRRPALYDVFEPSGAFIGQVQIPPGVSTVIRRGDYVWGVGYNDDDVAFVKRYRISWK